MACLTPPQPSQDRQPCGISEAIRDVKPADRPDIISPRILLAPKKLMVDFVPSPNQYKAAAKRHAGAKGKQPRSSQTPVLSLSLQCETAQEQDPEME
jgi:hypothetical protein